MKMMMMMMMILRCPNRHLRIFIRVLAEDERYKKPETDRRTQGGVVP